MTRFDALADWDSSTPVAPCDWRGVKGENGRVSELDLARRQLSGPFSPQVSNLRLLRKLSLSSNLFNGSIPSSIAKCSLPHIVFLQYNSFSDGIPPKISKLTSLKIFNVAGNKLSGGIPGDLPQSIRYFDLSSNAFTGEIPRNISSLTQLQYISLLSNRLSGEIPASLRELCVPVPVVSISGTGDVKPWLLCSLGSLFCLLHLTNLPPASLRGEGEAAPPFSPKVPVSGWVAVASSGSATFFTITPSGLTKPAPRFHPATSRRPFFPVTPIEDFLVRA